MNAGYDDRRDPAAQALAAAIRRLPSSRTAPVEDIITSWRADPPRACRLLLALPADAQAATLAALSYAGDRVDPVTTQRRRRRGLAAGIWAGIVACVVGSCGTAGADPGQLPRTPALVDDGDACGQWVSPNIGNPLGVLVGEAIHQAVCDAARQQPPAAGEPEAPPTQGGVQ